MVKKKFIFFIALLVGVMLFAVGCLGGRSGGEARQLPAPTNLALSGQTLSWSSVQNAVGYEVSVDGSVVLTSANTYSLANLTAAKTYQIKVKALASSRTYSDSDWSAPVSYTVASVLSAQVQQFLAAADALPGVGAITLADGEALDAALALYAELTEPERLQDGVAARYIKLVLLQAAFEGLKLFGLSPAAQAFIAAVNALPSESTVTLADALAVDAALAAYNALSLADAAGAAVMEKFVRLTLLKEKIEMLKIPGLSAAQSAFIAAVNALPLAAAVTTLTQAEAAEAQIAGSDVESKYAAIPAAELTHADVMAAKQKLEALKTKIAQLKTAAEGRLTKNVSTQAGFKSAWAEIHTAGEGTIVLTSDITLNDTDGVASGTYQVGGLTKDILIRSNGVKRTITLGNYSRFQIMQSGKITFENVDITFDATCYYDYFTNSASSVAVNIHEAVSNAAAVFTFIDCTVISFAGHYSSNSLLQATNAGGGPEPAWDAGGTFNLIRSSVTANYRPLGQSGSHPVVVFNLVDATITCTTDGGNALYRGNFNLYGSTTYTGTPASYAVLNNFRPNYPAWYTP
ncbi:MAG: fibronectin type III domain-containing protein [Firmicutes bacterium]|nr:fibronectin type III domain-containing protein [Bacillota bacterium]